MKELSLAGKTVWITGASAGIGESCARAFAATGANVLVTARRAERVRTLAAELSKLHGVLTRSAGLDVRDGSAVDGFVASLDGPWAEIAVLVNNAGLARGLEPVHEGSIEDWDEMIDTNVKGLLRVSRAAIPGMLARGRGHVINIGSVAGHEVYPGGNVYCATKHAVAALTRAMRWDYVDTALRFTAIDPGLVETEFSLVRFHGDGEKAARPYRGIDPLTADDVADAVVWAATRQPNVNVGELVMTPVHLASMTRVSRTE